MAQHYFESQDGLRDVPRPHAEEPVAFADNITHIDPRPRQLPSNEEQLRKIGENVIAIKHYDNGATEYSHNPISVATEPDGRLTVYFEKFQTGFTGNDLGLRHDDGHQGTETRSVVTARLDPTFDNVDVSTVHPRNYRYILIGLESRRHAGKAEAESEAIRYDLWHRPAQSNAAD